MQKLARRILKSSEVKLEGHVKLDPRCLPVQAPVYPRQGGGGDTLTPAQPDVRIVQSHPEFAVIEVVCCCGVKTLLRCQYAGGATHEDNSASAAVNEQTHV